MKPSLKTPGRQKPNLTKIRSGAGPQAAGEEGDQQQSAEATVEGDGPAPGGGNQPQQRRGQVFNLVVEIRPKPEGKGDQNSGGEGGNVRHRPTRHHQVKGNQPETRHSPVDQQKPVHSLRFLR